MNSFYFHKKDSKLNSHNIQEMRLYKIEKITAITKINNIIFENPPASINPKEDKSHKTKRIIAIVRKIPGSKLIITRITNATSKL